MTAYRPIPQSGAAAPDRATAASPTPLPSEAAVAHLITAANTTIADAHREAKATRLIDVWAARFLFALSRRLARMAWRAAMAGKARMQ